MDDPYDLDRFIEAQNSGGTYERAVTELGHGAKRGHWMWFVFPQIAGLGLSPTSVRYAITSLDEARAYLDHPVLRARLITCAGVVAATEGRTARQIFSGIDAQKLQSCMTLFQRAAPKEQVFTDVLDRFFDGVPDPGTERRV